MLSLGAPGYKDGLYPVEALNVYEQMPAQLKRYAVPERPWSPDARQWPSFMDAADAVVLDDGRPPDLALLALLDARFALGQRYAGRFAIYIAKRAPSAGAPSLDR